MISAMPAVAVRREREKNRQGKLIGDPFGRVNYIPGHQLHLSASYYHPHHLHHHYRHQSSSNQQGSKSSNRNNNSTDCVTTTTQTEDKGGLRFLIYSGFGCLAIGLICLLIGILTIKLPTQIIGLVFIGLGGLFCVIKVILTGKSSSSSSSLPSRTTTTRVETNGGGGGGDGVVGGFTGDSVDNSNNLNLIRTSINQPLVADSKQTAKLPNSPTSMPTGEPDCLNQTSSKSIDQQYLEAS